MSDGLTIGVNKLCDRDYYQPYDHHHSTGAGLCKGIINLRGQIIPIIDIRLRMGKPSIDYTKYNLYHRPEH